MEPGLAHIPVALDSCGRNLHRLGGLGNGQSAKISTLYNPAHPLVHDFEPLRPRVVPRAGEWIAVSVNLSRGLYVDEESELAAALLRRGYRELVEDMVAKAE